MGVLESRYIFSQLERPVMYSVAAEIGNCCAYAKKTAESYLGCICNYPPEEEI